MDPTVLFERAASGAVQVAGQVRSDQWHAVTPCSEWDVTALVAHMVAGTGYLMAAVGGDPGPLGVDASSYRAAIDTCVAAIRRPGALELRCLSPAGFEWSLAEAVAGTAMDQLVHTWDLAVAIGADATLDPELAETCVALFVPQMPTLGRAAGFVGPEVPVPSEASAQHRLLGAMGRHP